MDYGHEINDHLQVSLASFVIDWLCCHDYCTLPIKPLVQVHGGRLPGRAITT